MKSNKEVSGGEEVGEVAVLPGKLMASVLRQLVTFQDDLTEAEYLDLAVAALKPASLDLIGTLAIFM